MVGEYAASGAKYVFTINIGPFRAVKHLAMDRLCAVTAGRVVEEARQQAEILLDALREPTSADGDFLLAHAQHLLSCCRDIADSRMPLN